MKKPLLAFAATACAAALAAPSAGATTFPTLTTIYAASGVVETATTDGSGVMTAVSCTNMSGQNASVRFVFRGETGVIAAGGTLLVGNLATRGVSTQGPNPFINVTPLPTGVLFNGSVQVLSTESAVFCTAILAHPGAPSVPTGAPLHMVRFNPHPGTVE